MPRSVRRAPRQGASRSTAESPEPDSAPAFLSEEELQRLVDARRWALDLDPAQMQGLNVEIRMLRQALRDAFVAGQNAAVRQHAEVLRRLLRERAIVPEVEDDEEGSLEDGFSADLRRVLQRVGIEMGVDV